jgi:hypothetical protein
MTSMISRKKILEYFRGRGGRNTNRGERGQQAYTFRGIRGTYNKHDKKNI